MMRLEDIQSEVGRTEEWVKNADSKVGLLLGFSGALFIVILRHGLNIIFQTSASLLVRVGFSIGLILLVLSILESLRGIVPRLKHNQSNNSLLYFNDISRLSLSKYIKSVNTMNPAEYKVELLRQNHAIANIARRKMACFRNAILLLLLSLALMGVMELCQRLTI